MSKKQGKQTFVFDNGVYINNTFSVAGKQEGQGNFGEYYDVILEDCDFGCKSFEKAEIKLRKFLIDNLLGSANMDIKDIDCITGGDLLNQITPTSFSASEYDVPYLGLYGACSTFGESLLVSSFIIDGGYMDRIVASTSSHYCTAEVQYRQPLELGTQPTPTSQWTVTGAGGVILSNNRGKVPRIKSATIGKIIDLGIIDATNMGAAMAPAATDTIVTHLQDTHRSPEYYDMIVTGDLGKYGMDLLYYLADKEGYDLSNVLNDCGAMIYKDTQKATQGGSGAGCSSLVFASYIYKKLTSGDFKRVLLVPTGALLSRVSALQGQTIPGVAYAIDIEMEE